MSNETNYVNPQQLQDLFSTAKSELKACTSDYQAEQFRIKYLGKKGIFRHLLKQIKDVPINERSVYGSTVQHIQKEIEESFEQSPWKAVKDNTCIDEVPYFDPTLPAWPLQRGSIHPLIQTKNEICSIFISMGFSIAYGPDIETDYYNFEALNFPAHHPSRDMQDTFFVTDSIVLRTHTSPVQIRVMEKNSPPIRSIMPGTVYRKEEISSRSYCQFNQIEGLYVDTKVSMADLKGTLLAFAQNYFGTSTQIKIRPSFFPFTEPSIEIDVQCFLCHGSGCSVCKHSGWLEILGAGMVHPHVLRNCGIDFEQYSGFAFGMGIERIAMLKYQIDDIRLFYENDVRFLQQF